jgi:hypothetical protein
MDGDGIGGSVNIRTKTAADQPVVMASVLGGYTPIIGGRGVSQASATFGQRFGPDNRVGVLIGGTYDWNGRGINDIEPSPTVSSLSPHYDGMDLRDYMYYRTRWGLSGSTDYRVSNGSSIAVRGLYSTFRNWGQKWVYTLKDGDVPGASIDWRRPDYAVGNLVASGRHTLRENWLSWDVSFARSRMLQSGGNGGSKFKWNGPDTNCAYDPTATTDPYIPQFSASCYTPGPTNTQDIANYRLSSWSPASVGESAQRNLQGAAAYGQLYRLGEQFGTLEFGGKYRDAHKFDDSYTTTYTVAMAWTPPGFLAAESAVMNVVAKPQPGGGRHGCYDSGDRSRKGRVRSSRREPHGTDRGAAAAASPPVRAISRGAGARHRSGHGSVRHRALLGPPVPGARPARAPVAPAVRPAVCAAQ